VNAPVTLIVTGHHLRQVFSRNITKGTMALVGLGCVGAWAVLGSPGLPAAQQVTGAVVVLGSAALLAIKLRFLRLTGQSNQSLAQQDLTAADAQDPRR
jgi:hypothetical protein